MDLFKGNEYAGGFVPAERVRGRTIPLSHRSRLPPSLILTVLTATSSSSEEKSTSRSAAAKHSDWFLVERSPSLLTFKSGVIFAMPSGS